MKTGTIVFDGLEYPDGIASDPNALGWMQGSPPPLARRIRFEDDRYLDFPQIRWSLSHMRELVPTVAVGRGTGAAGDLGATTSDREAQIDALTFDDMHGRRHTWADSLAHTYTDGIIVLHRGVRVYERYFGALHARRPHSCFSITKSYAATLAATLIHERALDESRVVSYYLPEMAATAYQDATLRQVLDMQVGVDYSEDYADPQAHIWKYARAGGLRARGDDAGPSNYYEYLVTLRKAGDHGAAFEYKTVNTEVLCWVMKRVTGMALADMLSERIWSRIGCEEDGYLAVDSIGVAMGGGGLSATLRDLCRFGELMRCEGAWARKQVIPAEVVADIRRGSDPARFAKAGYTLLPGYSYRNMWWLSHNPLGVFEGRGIHGQRLYIAPQAELVVARFCSHPIATSAANDPVTLPAFAALCRLLMSR
jgi:CubicO group peptidase (beta-lactamase class C family)